MIELCGLLEKEARRVSARLTLAGYGKGITNGRGELFDSLDFQLLLDFVYFIHIENMDEDQIADFDEALRGEEEVEDEIEHDDPNDRADRIMLLALQHGGHVIAS